MKLIISSFLRTLRERDEFDRLLPDLLVAMGYTPVVRPQAGVRQFGVDLPVVGPNPNDKVEELVLFTIKQGDLGRQDWDVGVQAVRPSLNEILEVYLPREVEPAHSNLRKRIVLATTGDLKQDTQPNWTGFVEKHQKEAEFEFWSGDKVAELIERYMLDEHVFLEQDRTDLRKALAFAGERDYSMLDLDRMLVRQLGLSENGVRLDAAKDGKRLGKVLTRLNLALNMFVKAAQDAGDTRQAVIAAERFLLKAWHRIQQSDASESKEVVNAYDHLVITYLEAGAHYVNKMAPYADVRDGMSGYSGESAEYALVLLEHVGLIATIGLAYCFLLDKEVGMKHATDIADVLSRMLENMSATASPVLDENAIEVALALLLLTLTGRHQSAKWYLSEMCWRLVFAFAQRRGFPISSDSLDDLVDVVVNPDKALLESLMGASWMSGTLATWCATLGMEENYVAFRQGLKAMAPTVQPQLWHPDLCSVERWYFDDVHSSTGSTEMLELPEDLTELRARMKQFIELDSRDVQQASPARMAGRYGLDFIACRHHRFPVPARVWYLLAVGSNRAQGDAPDPKAEAYGNR
ncbi:hypothetical protein [Paraburkholderia sp. C35]|uniref:hypothetical protein n=1 Tax=Paraburkholderia sp. C35 TaxID=2126993 RepID=UPI000D69A564|nr:hypothetical protein [Paraburkholderia sp. C35]